MKDYFQLNWLRKANRIVLLVYGILAASLLFFYKDYIDSNDFLLYITLAEKYASGNWAGAINAFWSPLISWLIALLVLLHIPAVLAFKCIQLFAGGWGLYLGCRLLDRKNADIVISYSCKFALILFFLSAALLVGTPDLLLLDLILLFLTIICNHRLQFNLSYSPWKLGLVGTCWYFCKGFGFFAFLLSLSVIHILYLINRPTTAGFILKKYFLAVIVFLSLSACWVIPISLHKHRLTISDAGNYNLRIIGPAINPEVYGYLHHPFEMGYLVPPTRTDALNAWEDPLQTQITEYNPLNSPFDRRHYIKVISKNVMSVVSFHLGKDIGSVVFMAIMVLFLSSKAQIKPFFRQNYILFATALCFTIPYCLLVVMHRYVWINDIVLMLLFVDAITRINIRTKMLIPAFSLAFAAVMIHEPIENLKANINRYANFSAISKQSGLQGNVASAWTSSTDNYAESSILCYYAEAKYFGMLSVTDLLKVKEEIKNQHIDYLIAWDKKQAEILREIFPQTPSETISFPYFFDTQKEL